MKVFLCILELKGFKVLNARETRLGISFQEFPPVFITVHIG